MVVYMLERVPRGLRGELTRWMLEVHPNVFVGDLSAMVRDRLWEQICQESKGGAAVLVHSAEGEQGFRTQLWGAPTYWTEDFEGLTLVRRPKKERRVTRAEAEEA